VAYRRAAWIEVDLAAIRGNVGALKALLAPGVLFMAVVKANGYGHGILPAARAALAAGADRLGVALLEEGERLRRAGIGVPIQILGEMPPEGASRACRARLDVTTGRADTLDALAAAARRSTGSVRVHLKVDTGMRRIGCEPNEALGLARGIAGDEALDLAGVMTHFATSEEPDGTVFRSQLATWAAVREELAAAGIRPETWHAANSGATILSPETHHDMVRCGISIYGLHPGEATRGKVGLAPALALKARISHVKEVAAGEGASYGHAWHAERPTTVATLPVGYGDGYTRRLSNVGHAMVGGRKAPVVGNVTMDQILVAAPEGTTPGVGDEVTLIGPGVTADDLARMLGTINYEITCMLNGRLPRRYRGSART
jgi:alanine racemase